jgi:hypothetical protein
MSKYSKELKQTFPTMKELKQATKNLIKDGGDLAFKEYHDASSLERIKRELLK